MKRREFIKNISSAAMTMSLIPGEVFESYISGQLEADPQRALKHIQKLADEKPAQAEIKVKRGGPRLFLNGKEIYPLFALSTHMYPTIENFRKAGSLSFTVLKSSSHLSMEGYISSRTHLYFFSTSSRFFNLSTTIYHQVIKNNHSSHLIDN